MFGLGVIFIGRLYPLAWVTLYCSSSFGKLNANSAVVAPTLSHLKPPGPLQEAGKRNFEPLVKLCQNQGQGQQVIQETPSHLQSQTDPARLTGHALTVFKRIGPEGSVPFGFDGNGSAGPLAFQQAPGEVGVDVGRIDENFLRALIVEGHFGRLGLVDHRGHKDDS